MSSSSSSSNAPSRAQHFSIEEYEAMQRFQAVSACLPMEGGPPSKIIKTEMRDAEQLLGKSGPETNIGLEQRECNDANREPQRFRENSPSLCTIPKLEFASTTCAFGRGSPSSGSDSAPSPEQVGSGTRRAQSSDSDIGDTNDFYESQDAIAFDGYALTMILKPKETFIDFDEYFLKLSGKLGVLLEKQVDSHPSVGIKLWVVTHVKYENLVTEDLLTGFLSIDSKVLLNTFEIPEMINKIAEETKVRKDTFMREKSGLRIHQIVQTDINTAYYDPLGNLGEGAGTYKDLPPLI